MTDTPDASKTKRTQQQDKPRRQRKTQVLDGGTSPGDQKQVTYSAVVLKAVDWDKLQQGTLFSTSPDGSLPKVKDSISSYIDVKFRNRVTGVVGGTAYPVIL